MNSTLKTTILILCFLFLSIQVQSQKTTIDSLKNKLSQHTQKDTIEANLLIDIAESYFTTDMDSTQSYLTRANIMSTNLNYIKGKGDVFRLLARLEFIKSNYAKSIDFLKKSSANYNLINSKEGLARVYIGMGINYGELSSYEEAIIAYQKAEKIYQLLGNKTGIATCKMNMAIVYDELGKYDISIPMYKQALVLSNEIEDDEGVAYVNTNLGEVYQEQGNYPLALIHFHQALDYREKTTDYNALTYTLHGLGKVYFAMQKYEKALTIFEESLKYAVQTDDKNNVVANNSSIGDIYLTKNDYEKALKYYTSSLNTSTEINNLRRIANSHNRIGNVNLLVGKTSLALENFTQALQVGQETNNQKIMADSYIGIAETHISNKDYQKAISSIKRGEEIAKDLTLITIQKKTARLLSTIYKATKNYKKALLNHEIYKELSDSILNKENIEKITQLEYDYKYKQALDSASIRELNLTNTVKTTSQNLEKSQRNYLWAIIGVLLVSIVLGAIIFYQKFKNIKFKNETIVMEQKLLRSQMTPHFIFNSLSVLQGMILNNEDEKSVDYLSKFSKLLRLTLENSRDKMVLLSQEINAIEHYLELQNLEDMTYQYKVLVEDSVDASLLKIPPMLIQPFVENAVEHAFIHQQEDKCIDVLVKHADKKLVCTVTDNGVGVDTQNMDKLKDKKSLATAITSERLKMLSKDFNEEGSLTIEDRKKYNEHGTIVTIVIPHETSAVA